MNKNQLQRKLVALESELASGKELMAELDARRAVLHSQMLRINGAVQVLRELLDHQTTEPEIRQAAAG